MATELPLIPGFAADCPLFVEREGSITHGQFLARARALSRALPDAPWYINVCDDRGAFALAFCAALIRGAVSLFPPDRLGRTAQQLSRAYPGAVCLSDAQPPEFGLPVWLLPDLGRFLPDSEPTPSISADATAFVAFTSGSTGRPRPHPKRWGDLALGARVAARRFGFEAENTILATVPPQHMYGLELSIMVPLVIGAAAVTSRPLFAEDVRAALERAPRPRVLVTTPVHLRTCVADENAWPTVDLVISATAPLVPELAARVEAAMGTRVFEIYGSTESGSIASRRTCAGPTWTWYDGVEAHSDGHRVSVSADFLPAPVPLSDVLELLADGGFRLKGRATDMIKVGGKRASLADLDRHLNSIPGVKDGVFVAPGRGDDPVGRLAVIAVAPGLGRKGLIAGLRGRIDPTFYPRRVLFVDRMPRNTAGKLPKEALLHLLADETAASHED
jgi:acyl-coenzyme A synthetase/AMP-(fatty) acid ligase